MATNVLVVPGGSGNLVRFNGGELPVTLKTFAAALAGDLLLTVAGTAADNPELLGDAGSVKCTVKSSAAMGGIELVCVVQDAVLQQLIKTDGTEPLQCQPIAKAAL